MTLSSLSFLSLFSLPLPSLSLHNYDVFIYYYYHSEQNRTNLRTAYGSATFSSATTLRFNTLKHNIISSTYQLEKESLNNTQLLKDIDNAIRILEGF